jgi:hypothetical protein
MARGITVTAYGDGTQDTLWAFRELPKQADKELRDASERIARAMVVPVQAAARREGRQAAAVARTVRASRGRVPTVQAGGDTPVGRRGKPAWKLLFGSEFGGNQNPGPRGLRQFKPHLGAGSYWFFSTIESDDQPAREWLAAADRIIRKFGAA